MKIIYTNADYNIKADTMTGKTIITRGKNSMNKKLGDIADMPERFSKGLVEAGKNPSDYLFVRGDCFIILKDALDAWNNALSEYRNNVAAAKEKEKDLLLCNVPGLDILRAAHDDLEQYHHNFNTAMEDEHNDGVNMPIRPDDDTEALAKEYPRASIYLKAEFYGCASNIDKSIAGDKALKIIGSGGNIEEAKNILDNWLPENAIWN